MTIDKTNTSTTGQFDNTALRRQLARALKCEETAKARRAAANEEVDEADEAAGMALDRRIDYDNDMFDVPVYSYEDFATKIGVLIRYAETFGDEDMDAAIKRFFEQVRAFFERLFNKALAA